VPEEPIVNVEYFFDRGTRETIWKAQTEFDRWVMRTPQAPMFAVALVDRSWIREPRVFRRGNPANKGDEVSRRFLSVISGPNAPAFSHGSGRREMAEAIVDPKNPLTPRVWVNRVWAHHFGKGLVITPSDFGVRAEPPSHPELLDWLANYLMAEGWSTKSIHRLIVLSNTYQQMSVKSAMGAQAAKSIELDPGNRLLGRMQARRLTLEELRDTLLAVTKELDRSIGGSAAVLFPVDDGNLRRTLYGIVDRQYLPTVHRMFDFANPDLHIPQRTETTVPQQALFALNHPFFANRSRTLVANIASIPEQNVVERIDGLYQQVYQRKPTESQSRQAIAFLDRLPEVESPAVSGPDVTPWRYGFGRVSDVTGRVDNFRTFPQFDGTAWQGGISLPLLETLQLTARGGNAANENELAAVRRWIAPGNAVVRIESTVQHSRNAGDGVQCWIVSSRSGVLATSQVHNKQQPMNVERLESQPGDTIDFVTYAQADADNDDFEWSPVIRSIEVAQGTGNGDVDGTGGGASQEWDAAKGFSGPQVPPLLRWEQLAQVLLMSNELMFVD